MNENSRINFANAFQNAFGLQVTAEQFLQAESVSTLAFSMAAQEAGLRGLAAEFGLEKAAVDMFDGDLFEASVRWFLRKIWVDCDGKSLWWDFAERHFSGDAEKLTIARLSVEDDADGAMAVLTHLYGTGALAIGKAADAIESRFGCRWGRNGGDVSGLMAHITM